MLSYPFVGQLITIGLFMNQETPYINEYNESRPLAPQGNSMANAALILGIVAAFSTFTVPVYMPCVIGSISIVLALLSRGQGGMAPRARFGLVVAILAILLNFAMLIAGIYMYLTSPELQQELKRMIESLEQWNYYY